MKHNTIYFLVKNIQNEIKLAQFKSKWRKNNEHNLTVPVNIFPMEKVKVGKYTYGNLNCFFYGTNDNREFISIGNSCSLANGVKFLAGGEHKTNALSMFPYEQKYINKEILQSDTKGRINVEDEAWIGRDAIILSGVTIGKGSVVGAGSVVTKDIPPYCIAAGVPARVIKYRFDDKTRKALYNLNYSEFNLEYIAENIQLFESEPTDINIQEIIAELDKV